MKSLIDGLRSLGKEAQHGYNGGYSLCKRRYVPISLRRGLTSLQEDAVCASVLLSIRRICYLHVYLVALQWSGHFVAQAKVVNFPTFHQNQIESAVEFTRPKAVGSLIGMKSNGCVRGYRKARILWRGSACRKDAVSMQRLYRTTYEM